MTYEEALAWLDQRVNREAVSTPDAAFKLEGMRELMGVMADPQGQYPVVHVTGTNGKTSTARMLAALLEGKGLAVGAFTSPHLERVNERLAWNGEPISDGAFAELISALADLDSLLSHTPTWFELVTAAALRWFADVAVDAAVVEVGLGGRFDATNVADGTVAVVTNIGLDHVEYIGPTIEDIAHEKAGIVKPGSTLVLGETDPSLVPIFASAGAAATWIRDEDFACTSNAVAHGGRLLDVRADVDREHRAVDRRRDRRVRQVTRRDRRGQHAVADADEDVDRPAAHDDPGRTRRLGHVVDPRRQPLDERATSAIEANDRDPAAVRRGGPGFRDDEVVLVRYRDPHRPVQAGDDIGARARLGGSIGGKGPRKQGNGQRDRRAADASGSVRIGSHGTRTSSIIQVTASMRVTPGRQR